MPSNSSARNHPEQHPQDANREENHAWDKDVPPSPAENRYNSPGYSGASWARRSDRRAEYNRWGSPVHPYEASDRYPENPSYRSWEKETDLPSSQRFPAVPVSGHRYGQEAPHSAGYRSVYRPGYNTSPGWGDAGAASGQHYQPYGTWHRPWEGHRPSWPARVSEEPVYVHMDVFHPQERWQTPGSEEGYTWYEEEQAARHRELDRRAAEREEFGSGHHGRKSFRGVGPKAYRRSDERIREDICDRLSEDEWLDASGIEVLVKDGEVILNGHVDNRRSKRRAEDISESVSGVQHVQNNIRSSREVSV